MKKHLIIMLSVAMVLFWCGSVIASDVPTGGCENFPHPWGVNISCEGKYTLEDMGQMVDGDGNPETPYVWEWDPTFKNFVSYNNSSAWGGDWNEMTPFENNEIVNEYCRFDNKPYANADSNSRLSGLKGYINGMMIPNVWKMRVDDPANYPDQPVWDGHNQSYPQFIAHVDWKMRAECEQFCGNNGCSFDDGSAPDPDDNGPQEPCSWGDDNDPENKFTLYAGVRMEVVGEATLRGREFQNCHFES